MKLSEAIEKLEQNNGLKFKDSEGRLLFCEVGEIRAEYKEHQSIIDIDEEWELYIEPVDFITAINSGKRIKPLHSKNKFVYPKCWLWRISHNYNTSDKVEDYWLDFINGQWVVEP